ncbi:hypothetical protein [Acetanaerobacterium elongatum]|uniref:Peptidase propeptide and YPEB domain-containing protein n=1 Tax=Acetanaerobacterium elongatum TaxID=258515 RepID=A0A1H0GP13_9FIRM|nr:hypothetical protein [Acetanaerobacterium elongatum]SDO08766.1 hypothetical protein SAMN05192585_15310 [Acetanaerobacterium elongatum]
MKAKSPGKKGVRNAVLTTVAVLAVSAALFQGLTMMASAAEYKKTDKVPTSYDTTVSSSAKTTSGSSSQAPNLPEGYKKANYTVKDNGLDFFRKQKPAAKDISKEAAAENGAQGLWGFYNLSLEGQIIEMGYLPADKNNSRSQWQGDVYINGETKPSYVFTVDSITGELLSVGYCRALDKEVNIGFDAKLEKEHSEYDTLIKSFVKKYNLLNGIVKSIEISGQGYNGPGEGVKYSDPTISFFVEGENGKYIWLTFSRYDKALLSVNLDSGYVRTVVDWDRQSEAEGAAKNKAF